MKTQWAGRVVTGTRAIVLSTAYEDLKDWLLDYYDIDVECLSEHLTSAVLTDEARRYAMGLFGLSVEVNSEWSAERSAEAVYEYMQDRGVSLGLASPALGDDRGESGAEAWWRCGDEGEGWIWDVEIAAEYLYAAAHEN